MQPARTGSVKKIIYHTQCLFVIGWWRKKILAPSQLEGEAYRAAFGTAIHIPARNH